MVTALCTSLLFKWRWADKLISTRQLAGGFAAQADAFPNGTLGSLTTRTWLALNAKRHSRVRLVNASSSQNTPPAKKAVAAAVIHPR